MKRVQKMQKYVVWEKLVQAFGLLMFKTGSQKCPSPNSFTFEIIDDLTPIYLTLQVVHLQGEIETLENQMANFGVDASFGTSQAIPNSFSTDGLQVTYQPRRMNRQTYQSEETPPLSHELNRYANSQMNNMQPPTTYGLVDQKYIPWPNPSTRDRISEGIDQGIFGSYPWM